jgi:phospholipid N-methyltransferase
MICKRQASSSKADRIIIELGCGDGLLLRKLLEVERTGDTIQNNSIESFYIGIECDSLKYNKARSVVERFSNVKLLNGSFEVIIHEFSDCSIDKIISVLPDPEFIDIQNQCRWRIFYSVLYRKLVANGSLRIVTELIDDLLQPVTADAYDTWIQEIIEIFRELGFSLIQVLDGSPLEYESECLKRFKQDPQRIRLATFDFTKTSQNFNSAGL